MPSDLFDPMLELALSVAKKGRRAKPPVPAPPKVAPILKFKKVPNKAKEALYDTLDADEEFRSRVAEAATEAKVCLLYTSPSPRDKRQSRMPSSA